MAFPEAADIARGGLADAFPERVEIGAAEWAEAYWQVRGAERSGPMSFARFPYQRAVLEAMGRADVRVITVGGCAQWGKTEPIFAFIAYTYDVRPAHWMAMYPNAEKAGKGSTERFRPSLALCPRLAGKLVGGIDEQSAGVIRFFGGSLEWIGSNSPANTEGTPAAYCWIDEYDRCDEVGVRKMRQRGKTFSYSKLIETGTPGDEGTGIHARYLVADVRFTWHVPCPKCRAYYARVWSKDTVVWEGGGNAPIEQIRRTAGYKCPHCGEVSRAGDRRWQADRGVWLAQTQTVGKATDEGPGPIEGGIPAGAHWAFWLSGLDNELQANPVGEVAAEFMANVRESGFAGVQWETETLGRPHAPKARSLDITRLRARASAAPYAMGTAPGGLRSASAFALVDVQQDRAYVLRAAISPGMRDLFIVARDEVKGIDTEEKLERLVRKVKDTPMAVAGEPALPVELVGMDTGHRTDEVYGARRRCGGWVKLLTGYATRPGSGVSGPGGAGPGGAGASDKDPYKLTHVLESAAVDGKAVRLPLLLVNVTYWKNILAGVLARNAGEGGEGTLEGAGGGAGGGGGFRVWFPRDIDDAFLGHFTAERYIGGLWQLVRPGLRNDYWDLTVYAAAMAAYCGGRTVKARSHSAKEGDDERAERRPEPERARAGSRGILTG